MNITAFIEVAIVKEVKWWKKLNSRQKYAYAIGELLGITIGIAFGTVLGWVNGRIAQNLYMGKTVQTGKIRHVVLNFMLQT